MISPEKKNHKSTSWLNSKNGNKNSTQKERNINRNDDEGKKYFHRRRVDEYI